MGSDSINLVSEWSRDRCWHSPVHLPQADQVTRCLRGTGSFLVSQVPPVLTGDDWSLPWSEFQICGEHLITVRRKRTWYDPVTWRNAHAHWNFAVHRCAYGMAHGLPLPCESATECSVRDIHSPINLKVVLYVLLLITHAKAVASPTLRICFCHCAVPSSDSRPRGICYDDCIALLLMKSCSHPSVMKFPILVLATATAAIPLAPVMNGTNAKQVNDGSVHEDLGRCGVATSCGSINILQLHLNTASCENWALVC